jgi:hypothetical protein
MNVPYEDDWNIVPLIHSALHGHLTFGALWALHNENRILVPNLIFVAVGVLTHDNLKIVIVLSAAIFIAAYSLFLMVFASYQRRPLAPIPVLVLSAVWFSLDGWHNALWAFQVAWYLILLFLMTMLYALLVAQRRTLAFVVALMAAVLGSFSFFQGLALWPVGLICIVWMQPRSHRIRNQRVVVWSATGIVTIVAALWGYSFRTLACSVNGALRFNCPGSTSNFALHHPLQTAGFVFVELGEIIPNSHSKTLWWNGMLGACLFVIAGFIVIQSIRHRDTERNCLPVVLIVFGLLFDGFIAVGFAFLPSLASQSGYTMPNLLVLVGIAAYALVHFRPRSFRLPIAVALIVLLAIQLAATTDTGLVNARAWDEHLATGARLVVNLNEIPAKEQTCYSFYGVFVYLLFYPGEYLRYVGFTDAREDQLSVFSTPQLQSYRRQSLPIFPQC